MALVHIDSENRTSGASYDFDIAVDLPQNKPITECTLADAVIPLNAFTLDEDTLFHYTEFIDDVHVDKSVTFPAGNYTLESFGVKYTSLMDVNTDYTFSASECYQFGVDTPKNLIVVLHQPDADVPVSPQWKIYWSRQPKLARLLGFDPIDTALGTDFTATSAYNFGPENFLYIHLSPGFPQCFGTFKPQVPCTFPVSLHGDGSVGRTEKELTIPVTNSILREGSFRVRLYRRDGTLYKLNSNWGMTLIFS